MSIEQTRGVILSDLDPDFLESVSKAVAWQYDTLFELLAQNVTLTDDFREEEFARRRSACAVMGLTFAATKHGVPYEFMKLASNGQRKLLVKVGRIILIQEPILSPLDHPRTSDYKCDLADVHGYVRQLEFELGDQPFRIRDWSGCALAVLLHGPTGKRFTHHDKSLGNILLAVPDADYQQWILRFDLHQVAMFGSSKDESATDKEASRSIQDDEVVVTRKKKNAVRGTANQ